MTTNTSSDRTKLPDIMQTPVFQKDGIDYARNPSVSPENLEANAETTDVFRTVAALERSAATISELETPLRPGECWVLDAPGITGMGANAVQRMKEYVEAGGKLVHRVRLGHGDGTLGQIYKIHHYYEGRGCRVAFIRSGDPDIIEKAVYLQFLCEANIDDGGTISSVGIAELLCHYFNCESYGTGTKDSEEYDKFDVAADMHDERDKRCNLRDALLAKYQNENTASIVADMRRFVI